MTGYESVLHSVADLLLADEDCVLAVDVKTVWGKLPPNRVPRTYRVTDDGFLETIVHGEVVHAQPLNMKAVSNR